MRQKIVAGNWKMNKDATGSIDLINELIDTVFPSGARVMIAPATVFLDRIAQVLLPVAAADRGRRRLRHLAGRRERHGDDATRGGLASNRSLEGARGVEGTELHVRNRLKGAPRCIARI